jgi:transcriptional regulator with XRE-family HTH domain
MTVRTKAASTPDQLIAALAAELRRLRHTSGRSLRDLERETFISDSALSRYLSGRTLPPWPVVETLSRLGGADPKHLRTLWESARVARAGRRSVRSVRSDAAATDGAETSTAGQGRDLDQPAALRHGPVLVRAGLAIVAGMLLGATFVHLVDRTAKLSGRSAAVPAMS